MEKKFYSLSQYTDTPPIEANAEGVAQKSADGTKMKNLRVVPSVE